MRIFAGLLLGLLAAVVLVAALHLFTHVAAERVQGWSQQNPPPPVTLPRLLLIRSANLASDFLIPSIPILLVAFPLLGWRLAVRSSR